MRNVIQKVLETEAEANRLIEAAKVGAENIVAQARKEAEEQLTAARRESDSEAAQLIAAKMEVAQQEKEELLAKARARMEARIQLDDRVFQRAVEAVVACVCGRRLAARPPPP